MRRSIAADIASTTSTTARINHEVGRSCWVAVPFLLEATIALYEVVRAESRSPTHVATRGVVGPVFAHVGDLAVVHEVIAVGEKGCGTLGVRVDDVCGVGEVEGGGWGGGIVWRQRELQFWTIALWVPLSGA